MGRAFEVRKMKMAKTNAVKSRVYAKYGKQIYIAAKNNPDPNSNAELSSVIKAAKRAECTKDIIDRAIAKAKSNEHAEFKKVTYEGFITKGAYIIIECNTDNLNRTAPEIKSAFNKSETKLGVPGSVTIYFDHFSVIVVKDMSEDSLLELAITNDLDVINIETSQEHCVIYASPQQLHKITNVIPDENIVLSEIKYISQDSFTLSQVDKAKYDKLMLELEKCEDIDDIFTNIEGE